ncbi:MAG: hypothetical protein ACTHKT_10595 [Solirubrobacterales bacterium]
MARPKLNRALLAALMSLAGLLLALPASAAACGESAPPLIKSAKVSPSSLPYEGGTIHVTTEVETVYDCGVNVWAEVNTTEGLNWNMQLLSTSDPNLLLQSYEAQISAPANYQESPNDYQVRIWVEDAEGGFAETYAGDAEVAGAPPFDEAPYVSNATLTPAKLGTEGGWVTIAADISDNRSISYAFANVMLPDETLKEVPLEPVSSSHFVGHYKAPPNFGTSAQKYPVVVYGEDDIGQQSFESAGTFSVAGRRGPLSAVTESNGYIGNVTVGRTATRIVTVHNSGSKGIKASISVSGASFALRGGTGGKIDFWVSPGETRYFRVDFTPTALGPASGVATVARVDGAQPNIVLNFTGKGIPPAS